MDDVPESSPDLDVSSSDDPLEAPIVASGNESSSAAMDDVPESSPDLDITLSEEPPSPDESIPPDNNPLKAHGDASEFKYDKLIFDCLHGGDGRDIDGIANYILEKHEVADNFREELIQELKDLGEASEIEKVGDRYKNLHASYFFEESEKSSAEAVSTPTQTTSTSKELTSTSTQKSSEGAPPPNDRRPSTSPPDQQNQKKRKII